MSGKMALHEFYGIKGGLGVSVPELKVPLSSSQAGSHEHLKDQDNEIFIDTLKVRGKSLSD